MNHPNVKTDDN